MSIVTEQLDILVDQVKELVEIIEVYKKTNDMLMIQLNHRLTQVEKDLKVLIDAYGRAS